MNAADVISRDLGKMSAVKDGTVVKFVSGGVYTYVAVFVVGRWWLSGTANFYERKYTHARFMELLSDDGITEVDVADGWVNVKQ